MSEQRVIEDPVVLKQRLSFRRTTGDDGEDVLQVEVWVDPGGGVTPHIHPVMEERFKVLSGNPSFLAGKRWQTASPGETVVVPPGMRHAYRNRGNEVAHVVCEARPPQSLQEFLEEAVALGRDGKLDAPRVAQAPGGAARGRGNGRAPPRHGRAAVPADAPTVRAAADLPAARPARAAPRLRPRAPGGGRLI